MSSRTVIQDIYSIQKFQKVFSIYFRALTPVVIITFILGITAIRSLHFEQRFFDKFFGNFLIVVVLSSIVFSSYMLYTLFKEKKKNWIASFVLIVLLPYLFLQLIFKQFMYFKFYAVSPIVTVYYIYCFSLKHNLEKWIEEYYGHQNRLEQKRLKEEEAERLKNGLF